MIKRFALSAMVLACAAVSVRAAAYTEGEIADPTNTSQMTNNTKLTAELFTLASGDTLSGKATGYDTTSLATSRNPDYFKITTVLPSTGIYLHTLTSSASTVFIDLRGVKNAFTSANDSSFTNGGNESSGRSPMKWYSVGSATTVPVKIGKTATSTINTAYTLTMTNTLVTPVSAGSVTEGLVTLAPALVGDSEIFVYDSAYNLVGQNDDTGVTVGAASISLTLTPGTYYVAVGSGNSASSKAWSTDNTSPFFGTANFNSYVMDPSAGPALARPENLSRTASDFGLKINGGTAINAAGTTQALEMAFYQLTVTAIPEPSALGLLAPAAMLVARRRRA
jgi:hypothetical protein